MLPNVIIAGTQKAGTTSLFRYLSDHYCVCPSSIKEVDFFLKYQNKIDSKAIDEYRSYFGKCSSGSPIRLEASPRYLKMSSLVAKKMHDYLPNAKLVFILREPISVLLSYLKWKSTSSKSPLNIHHVTSYIKRVNIESTNDFETKNIAGRIYAGCYADKLSNFLKYYSKSLIGVFFYDDLLENCSNFMHDLCKFLEIDGSFYNNYQFNIENKTRAYKYPSLHRMASKVYLKFEIFFNRYPFARRQLRTLYHLICETKRENYKLTDIEKKRLEEFYEPHNRNLYKLLQEEFPHLRLPIWLKQ